MQISYWALGNSVLGASTLRDLSSDRKLARYSAVTVQNKFRSISPKILALGVAHSEVEIAPSVAHDRSIEIKSKISIDRSCRNDFASDSIGCQNRTPAVPGQPMATIIIGRPK